MEEKLDLLEEQLDELANQLAEGFYQTLQMLATIVTLLERYYEGSHSRFISDKSAAIAEAIGMNETEVFEIRIAGLLHDIGKIGFKDSLLFKYPQEMNQHDYRQYVQHPELGMQILKRHKGFDNIGEIIFQHHEKYDGSGFPQHLQHKSIHPGAAIISVVNTYHNAMFKRLRDRTNTASPLIKYSSAAAYMESTKDRYTSAINYLTQKKGILFDPKVVEVFMDTIQKERLGMGRKTVNRIPVNRLVPGMIFAEDYFTSYGLLIAARGEVMKGDMMKYLVRFAESGDIPQKILVMT